MFNHTSKPPNLSHPFFLFHSQTLFIFGKPIRFKTQATICKSFSSGILSLQQSLHHYAAGEKKALSQATIGHRWVKFQLHMCLWVLIVVTLSVHHKPSRGKSWRLVTQRIKRSWLLFSRDSSLNRLPVWLQLHCFIKIEKYAQALKNIHTYLETAALDMPVFGFLIHSSTGSPTHCHISLS